MSWLLHITAVGMVEPNSHSAQDGRRAVLEVMRRYGVSNDDIKFSMSDTTNSALRTGRELTSAVDALEGKCTMHLVNLAVDHAIGKRTRNKNHVIVDSFPVSEELRKKICQIYCISDEQKV